MKHLTTLLAALGLVLMSWIATAEDTQASERYGVQKVVYHINYPGGEGDKKYRGAMRNVQNHINAVGAENMEIKIVMHGNGVGLVKNAKNNADLQNIILGLKSQNVGFQICNNTLVGRKISYENDLFDVYEEDIVPSGVAELTHLQQMGYTYIKP